MGVHLSGQQTKALPEPGEQHGGQAPSALRVCAIPAREADAEVELEAAG
jgi:hypothetical protein